MTDERHLAHDRSRADGGDVLPTREHAGLARDHEEALGAHVALVHEDGAGFGVDGLSEGRDLRDVALVHVGEQR